MEEVAGHLEDHTDTYFAAVNCWTSAGHCYRDFGEGKARNHQQQQQQQSRADDHGHVQRLPIFVYYPKDRKGLQYMGPQHSAQAVAQFLRRTREPLQVKRPKA